MFFIIYFFIFLYQFGGYTSDIKEKYLRKKKSGQSSYIYIRNKE